MRQILGSYGITLRCDAYGLITKICFSEVYKSFGSELDFKVAWFDLSMIDSIGFWGFCFNSLVFYCMYCIIQCPEGEGKKQ